MEHIDLCSCWSVCFSMPTNMNCSENRLCVYHEMSLTLQHGVSSWNTLDKNVKENIFCITRRESDKICVCVGRGWLFWLTLTCLTFWFLIGSISLSLTYIHKCLVGGLGKIYIFTSSLSTFPVVSLSGPFLSSPPPLITPLFLPSSFHHSSPHLTPSSSPRCCGDQSVISDCCGEAQHFSITSVCWDWPIACLRAIAALPDKSSW